MTKNCVSDVINGIIENSKAKNPPQKGDWINDGGLLVCGKCGRVRQKRLNVFGDDVIVPVMCECKEKERAAEEAAENALKVERFKKEALPSAKYRSMTFEASDTELPYAKYYADNWAYMLKNEVGLLLHGGVGSGKTYMAAAIANRLIERGEWVHMDNMASLSVRMNDQFKGGRAECIDRVCDCNLMIFDDFGAEKSTATVEKNVYELINMRSETNKPMIVTTNLSPKSFPASTEDAVARAYSRLKALHPVVVHGTDRREQGTKDRFAEIEKILKGGTR